jgi:hypothetical protein
MIVDSKPKRTFFCQSLGPTVEVLAFYGAHHRSRLLLQQLSKKTA